jgi:protein-tyrosine phosphatase
MAEAVFANKLDQKGLTDQMSADSAGTSNYHIGGQPDPRTLQTLTKHKIQFTHAARQVSKNDAEIFHYIVAMDKTNYANLQDVLSDDYPGLKLMRDFDPLAKGADVPDPYYGGQDGFEQIYQIIDRSIEKLIEYIIEQNHDK